METNMAEAVVPKIIGHRGAAGHAPENTLVSVQRAYDLGVRWIEVDVKLSSDDVPVLFHDDKLERTTNGKGPITRKRLNELKDLDAGGWFESSFAGERIPTLVELVATSARLGLGLNLELKPSPGEEEKTGRVAAEVLQVIWPAALPAPMISSFKPEALAAFSGVAPDMERALLFHKLPKEWLLQARALGVSALHCKARHLKRDHVDAIRDSGLAVRCFTVNEDEDAQRLFRWGVGSVFTDFPDRLA